MNPSLAARRFGLAAVLLLAGCASRSTQEPLGELIRNAGNTVAEAEDARASDYAPKEMREAREKIQAAQDLSRKARNDGSAAELEQARWLAEEAGVEAKLAEAKAQNTRMQGLLRDRQRPIEEPAAPPGGEQPLPEPVPAPAPTPGSAS